MCEWLKKNGNERIENFSRFVHFTQHNKSSFKIVFAFGEFELSLVKTLIKISDAVSWLNGNCIWLHKLQHPEHIVHDIVRYKFRLTDRSVCFCCTFSYLISSLMLLKKSAKRSRRQNVQDLLLETGTVIWKYIIYSYINYCFPLLSFSNCAFYLWDIIFCSLFIWLVSCLRPKYSYISITKTWVVATFIWNPFI